MTSSSLQNMAPEAQRSLMASLVFGVLAVVIYMFCIETAEEGLKKTDAELVALHAQEKKDVEDIAKAESLCGRLEQIKADRKVFLDGLLVPQFGSYFTVAAESLRPIAAESGVELSNFGEPQLPRRLLPLPIPAAQQLYARHAVRLSCRGSYAGIISFLLRVEKCLPLVSLQSLSIKPVQNENEVQTAEMVFEWPVAGEKRQPMVPAAQPGGVKK